MCVLIQVVIEVTMICDAECNVPTDVIDSPLIWMQASGETILDQATMFGWNIILHNYPNIYLHYNWIVVYSTQSIVAKHTFSETIRSTIAWMDAVLEM